MRYSDLTFFVSDIETYDEYFLFGGKFQDGEVVAFHINRWQNDLYRMVRWIEAQTGLWYVGFNFYSFDSQVIQWILYNYENWHDRTNLEICALIAQFAGDRIDDSNYDLQPPFRIDRLEFKIIDLFRTHHFDNKNNKASLKWLEIMMDMPQVAEMPIHHAKKDLTKEECQMVYDYWLVDLEATSEFLNITLGKTDLELYKGKNMLQERLDVAEKYGFKSLEALNWSDTKIGEQITMHKFCKRNKCKPEDVYEMKRKRKQPRPFTFGKCIPDHVKFQTKPFQEFYDKMKSVRVRLGKDKTEYPFHYNGTMYTIARGGIHSVDPRRIIVPPEGYTMYDIDLGGQYPVTLIRRVLYPAHLTRDWVDDLLDTVVERVECKKESKKEGLDSGVKAELEGRSEYLKKSMNAGRYGMLGQPDSWQYDPFIMYSCTIGNEFEMLMLIETLELNGIHCISANTDGLSVILPNTKDKLFHDLCGEWEDKIGLPVVNGEKQGALEYTVYEKFVQEHVNAYMAFKKGGKVKFKGRFQDQVLLNKNNTKDITRIQRIAIQEYFKKGTPVKKTIKECTNIMKFCFGYKSGRFEFIATKETGEQESLGHLLRCYASTTGVRLRKSKEDDLDKKGNIKIIKDSLATPYNYHIDRPFQDYNVNYEWYIRYALDVVRAIEGPNMNGRKKKPPPPSPSNQTSLF